MSDASSDNRILLTRSDAIATITLNRPSKLNAIDPPMLDQLDDALSALDRDTDIRVVLIEGAGERAFCVGADIHAWAALEPLDMWRQWIPHGHRVFNRLAQLRQPTIALIHSYAFGGGLELALAADLRLGSPDAQCAQPETKLGTIPGWAATARLPGLIGRGRAKQMILTGTRVDATTAERWGLLNEIVPMADLKARAIEIAREIAANAPIAVQLAKQAIDGTSPSIEAIAGALAASTADGREGVAAFRDKRTPQFEGH